MSSLFLQSNENSIQQKLQLTVLEFEGSRLLSDVEHTFVLQMVDCGSGERGWFIIEFTISVLASGK